MFLNILKKDIKRKKTMNVILLIFIILAATFISSSVNNLYSITTALNNYFEMAELSDYVIITLKDEANDSAIVEFLDHNDHVDSWAVDENLYVSEDKIEIHNGGSFTMSSTGMLSSIDIEQQKFFDVNNNEITEIKSGEIYLPLSTMEKNGLSAGDTLTIEDTDFSMDFIIAGNCKDALLGSTLMGNARLIISSNDYNTIKVNTDNTLGNIYSITSSDVTAFERDFNQMGFNVITSCDQDLVSMTYIMDMVIAGLLLVVSVCLIIISLVILRFTIVFTLNEEFREIGVMKAIGIRAGRIRRLYIIKYLAVSVLGAAIGFILSIPFGNIFIEQISRNIIISTSTYGLLINLGCSAAILILILLFCYSCTHHVNKFSPATAIRNGSNGERYKRKGALRLSKSKLSTVLFMALNDILSGPKRFGVLVITFTIGIILVIVPINTINTLNGDNLVRWFGMAKTDIYMVNDSKIIELMTGGSRDAVEQYLEDLEYKLAEEGIEASVSTEMMFKFKISKDDYGYNSIVLQGTGISADEYTYTLGTPPEYENEIALTHITAKEIGADIGDTVKLKAGASEEEYVVIAIYQSMNNLGEGVRVSEKAEIDYHYAIGALAVQIRYEDNPTDQEIQERFNEMKELFPGYTVYTGGEYISSMMGDTTKQLEGVKRIILVVIILINMLVAVLMVRTFLAKEKGEIGILKSIGFKNSAIAQWQLFRIGIILLVSTILGALLSNPIAQISSGKVFEMMGASHIEFAVKPLEVYVIYPLLIFAMTMVSSTIAALEIKKITVQETNNIE